MKNCGSTVGGKTEGEERREGGRREERRGGGGGEIKREEDRQREGQRSRGRRIDKGRVRHIVITMVTKDNLEHNGTNALLPPIHLISAISTVCPNKKIAQLSNILEFSFISGFS